MPTTKLEIHISIFSLATSIIQNYFAKKFNSRFKGFSCIIFEKFSEEDIVQREVKSHIKLRQAEISQITIQT